MKCAQCGVDVQASSKFCGNCGAPILDQEPPGPTPSSQSDATMLDQRLAGCLVVESGNMRGQVFELGDSLRIGRIEDNDLYLDDPQLSRHHAIIHQDESGYTVSDLDSTNGTFLNGERITGQRRLAEGDRIRVGNTSLVFRWLSEAEQASPSTVMATTAPPAVVPAAAEYSPPPAAATPAPKSSRPSIGLMMMAGGVVVIVCALVALGLFYFLPRLGVDLTFLASQPTASPITLLATNTVAPAVTVVVTNTPEPTAEATATEVPTATPPPTEAPAAIRLAADGSGDYPGLAEAVAAVQPGSTIYLDPGMYQLASTLILEKPLSLIGAGMDATYIVGQVEDYLVYASGPGPFVMHDITFRFEGTGRVPVVTVRDGEIDILRCRFTGEGLADGEGGDGLLMAGSTTGSVRDSRFEQNGLHGIELQEQAQPALENNLLANNRQNGIAYFGASGGVASGNTCTGNELHGISVLEEAAPLLEGNVAEANEQVGIRIAGTSTATVRQNEARSNGLHGFLISDQAQATLEGNLSNGNTQVGISFLGSAAGVARQNQCAENNWGIFVQDAANPELVDNQCQGNAVADIVLWADNFDDPESGWWTGSTEGGQVSYQEGELHILDYVTPEAATISTPGRSFSDLVMTVDSRLVAGTADNWHGFYCRYGDADNWYVAAYSADGWYTGLAKVNGESTVWVKEQSDAILTGTASNRVRLECVGSSIRFWVNNTLLIDATDSRLASGDIGLDAESDDEEQTHIAFDNLRVLAP